MLLPYCTSGISHFQQKPWPMAALGPVTVPMPALPIHAPGSHIGLGAFRHGACHPPVISPFHANIGQSMQHRPTLFPSFHLPATIRPIADVPKPKPSPPAQTPVPISEKGNKKMKLFRPWDDEVESNPATTRPDSPVLVSSSTSFSSPSSTSSYGACPSLKKLGDFPPRPKLVLPASDDLEQSKSAFEVFATNLGKSADGHRCIYCGKMYSRKYGLKIHLRTHTGFKPLKCKVCQRPFGDPSNLNKHVRLHADVLVLPASVVEVPLKKAERDYSVDGDHYQHHHQLSLFKCPFCGRSLVRKRDLERHLASRHPNEHLIDVERL